MNCYLYVSDGTLNEIVPEVNPALPGFPIEKRYTKKFLDACIVLPEEEVETQGIVAGMLYDPETQTFSVPPEPETVEEGNNT